MSNKKKRNVRVRDVVLNVFSNDPNPIKYNMLEMFCRGALTGTLGLMDAMNTETNEVETILVGISLEDGKQVTYPLATLINAEASGKYLAPDGKGGYGRDDATV